MTLHNWLRYRGDHEVFFEPTIYGVTASHEADPARSNWLGKTSILAGVRFALFGTHPARTEDEWITRGEAEGSVRIELSDGMTITRERKRGSATRLFVRWPGREGEPATGAAAQAAIVEALGLTEGDFMATCFFEQKNLARFVVARPAERQEIVAGWLQLGKLQAAESRTRRILGERIDRKTTLVAKRDAMKGEIVAILASRFDAVTDADANMSKRAESEQFMIEAVFDLQNVRDAAKAVAEEAREAYRRREAWEKASAAREAFDRAVASVEEANVRREKAIADAETALAGFDAAKVEASLRDATKAQQEAIAALARARDTESQRAALACGAFDGVCPVDGHVCPDAEIMNAAREANEISLREAVSERVRADKAVSSAKNRVEEASESARRIEALRGQINALKRHPVAAMGDPPPDPGEAPPVVDAVTPWDAYQAAEADYREAEQQADRLRRTYDGMGKLEGEIAAAEAEIDTLREAVAILGRQGAQRVIAEGALSEIEDGANALLREAGIDLRVVVRWSHEGQGLATTCEACGAPFPSSTKVRECAKCGATRGAKMIDRLEVVLSDRSGAADDLAGAAIQLAAGAWLRKQRNAAWSVALIDEPFGALDEANRGAFAVHLAAMLRGRYGYAQAFVIAHTRGVMDALPGRVEVTGREAGSSLRVV
jgi:DNA repair exonuclease SbcCD ATPase subunit